MLAKEVLQQYRMCVCQGPASGKISKRTDVKVTIPFLQYGHNVLRLCAGDVEMDARLGQAVKAAECPRAKEVGVVNRFHVAFG